MHVSVCAFCEKRQNSNKLTEVHCFLSNVIYIQFAIAAQFFFSCCLFEFAHFGCFCFLCQLFSGGCINASPAGKRRIANGIEQQQFGDDSLFGISGKLSIANDGNGNNGFGRITPATTAITAFAVAACVLIISVFAIVFVVIQVCTIFLFSFFLEKKVFCSFSLRPSVVQMNRNLRYDRFIIVTTIGESDSVGISMSLWYNIDRR